MSRVYSMKDFSEYTRRSFASILAVASPDLIEELYLSMVEFGYVCVNLSFNFREDFIALILV